MAYLALLNVFIAIFMGLWQRTLLHARGDSIPCTARTFSGAMVAVGVAAMGGNAVANVLVLKAIDNDFGRHLSPLLFTCWLLTMSAADILFIIAIVTLHNNRRAAAWIRVVPPDELVFRMGRESTTLKLKPGSVHVLGIVGGIGGLIYVQYRISNGDQAITLAVPFTRDAGLAMNGAQWLRGISGLTAQGGERKLHQHFASFREPHTGT